VGLPRNLRIRKTSEYRRIYAAGRKIHREAFVVFYLGNDSPHHRLGITATRRLGNAVLRNRIKRRIREAFRRERSSLGPHGVDLVVNARRRVETLSWEDLREEFRNCGVMIQKEMERG
jgi:ribonuclease P protein component